MVAVAGSVGASTTSWFGILVPIARLSAVSVLASSTAACETVICGPSFVTWLGMTVPHVVSTAMSGVLSTLVEIGRCRLIVVEMVVSGSLAIPSMAGHSIVAVVTWAGDAGPALLPCHILSSRVTASGTAAPGERLDCRIRTGVVSAAGVGTHLTSCEVWSCV